MAEQSYLFDFTRVDTFFDYFNIAFFIDEMWQVNGYDEDTDSYTYDNVIEDACFELVLIEYGADNIDEYLTADGFLDTTAVEGIHRMDCGLDWYNRGDGEATIELHDDVTFNIGDVNMPLKAILLINKSTNYVMGYSINTNPFSVTNQVVLDDDVIFWDISRFNQ